MVFGGLLTVVMAPAENVTRPDGSYVTVQPFPSVVNELRALSQLVGDWRLIALTPLFLYSNWFYAYQFVSYNSKLFNARTEGLNNTFYWGAQMIGALLIGKFLDSSPLSLRRRALVSFLSIAAAIAGSWAWGLAANTGYRLDETPTEIDFQDGRWPAAALLYLLWGFCDAFIQCWVYWLLGQLDQSPEVLSRFAGGYKAIQCVGAAASWALSTGTTKPSTQAWINVALLACSLPSTVYMLLRTPQLPDEAPQQPPQT
eukprot:CAMPEP_0181211036 /NCGR_PEP_ID=MMETSP1096-20121128/23567_1 /TAXON_ID=156174 ORGANISM="Chrysochromulina ericina, Strain CCMP281" /NCGR_SAMPLE_ID=MMETSP1096 /ASSEMBLY_ACC=CAM_ASM_000453 /LENGTH=256 /DNA_ID=CAMNT_0023302401 /DNA_START=1 /DNA_END=771 /DNA_ORIENTATION=+